MRSASAAPTSLPVSTMSRAWLWPIRRGSRTVPPSTSGMPKRRQNTPKSAFDATTRRSHQMASSRPPATAKPSTAARTGLDVTNRVGPMGPRPSSLTGRGSPSEKAFRSAPAQKVPPVPVSTATPAASSPSNASKACSSRRAVDPSTAFRRWGRLMATTVTGPWWLTRTESACSLGGSSVTRWLGRKGCARRQFSQTLEVGGVESGGRRTGRPRVLLNSTQSVDNKRAIVYAGSESEIHRSDDTLTVQKEHHMAIRLGDTAPDFTAETTEGTINFHEYLGDSWGVLFSHPKDFTPICTTELGAFSKAKPEFDKRNTKLIGLSVDDVTSHGKWASDIEETQGSALNFPLIGDEDRKVADLYDMIHPNANDTLTVRSVFVIGPDKKVKLTLTYPASTGRNVDEILRVLDSLQLTADYKVATPVDWKDGDDVVIIPAVSDEEAKERFPKGFKALKPYLRLTPQPNK